MEFSHYLKWFFIRWLLMLGILGTIMGITFLILGPLPSFGIRQAIGVALIPALFSSVWTGLDWWYENGL